MAHESFTTKNSERDQRCQQAAEEAGYDDWWSWVRALEEEAGREICGAPRRRVFIPCKMVPAGNGRCKRYHGGKAAVGPAHPSWKTGEHSKLFDYLPGRLREGAQRVYEDEKLVQGREQIAVLNAHAEELLSKGLHEGESGAAWKAIRGRLKNCVHALSQDDAKGLGENLREAVKIANDGVGEVAVWREYRQVVDDMRRHRETELNRMKYLSAFIAADKASAMFRRIVEIINECVDDREALRLILGRIDKEFGRGSKSNGEKA